MYPANRQGCSKNNPAEGRRYTEDECASLDAEDASALLDGEDGGASLDGKDG